MASTSSMRFLKKTMTHYAKEMEKDDRHVEADHFGHGGHDLWGCGTEM